MGLCWTAGRSGAHHGLCEPQPVSAPSHPHDTSHHSQLYIAALNVLIGISRAQQLEVRVTTAAHNFHGRLALLPCMGHCCCVPLLPLLLLCTCPAQTAALRVHATCVQACSQLPLSTRMHRRCGPAATTTSATSGWTGCTPTAGRAGAAPSAPRNGSGCYCLRLPPAHEPLAEPHRSACSSTYQTVSCCGRMGQLKSSFIANWRQILSQ